MSEKLLEKLLNLIVEENYPAPHGFPFRIPKRFQKGWLKCRIMGPWHDELREEEQKVLLIRFLKESQMNAPNSDAYGSDAPEKK